MFVGDIDLTSNLFLEFLENCCRTVDIPADTGKIRYRNINRSLRNALSDKIRCQLLPQGLPQSRIREKSDRGQVPPMGLR